jgi:hypothetical protein
MMRTPVESSVETKERFQPAPAQLERAAAQRLFNLLYVYIPIALASLIIIGLIGLLFWGVFSPNVEGTRQFASALADIIVIGITIPLMLLCAVGPVSLIGVTVYRRKRRQPEGDPRPYGRLQTLLWRLDALVANIQAKLVETLPRIARPIIEANARAAYLHTFLEHVKKIFSRS